MHAHRSSYPRISSVPLIRISHLAPTPPGLSCGSGRAQGSGAGIWCGAGAALSPIPLVLGFLEPILKGWSKPVSTPPRPLQSFRHICPGSFSFMLLAASLLSALFAVSLHSMFVTDGPCVCVHLLLVSSFGCSLEGSGSTHFCGYDVF
jgi:hypothetical protein